MPFRNLDEITIQEILAISTIHNPIEKPSHLQIKSHY